jgi:ribosomal protein S18 acetylase RimI-like enzyme
MRPDVRELREATAGDAGAVAELWTTAYVSEGEGGRTEPYREADFFETAGRGRVLISSRGGEVVGVAALLGPGAPGKAVARDGEAELCRLVVAAGARRQGIARMLVERCEELAREAGWKTIALWSRRYQIAAHGLYESLGYRRVPERDSVDASGHRRLVFRLEL